MPSRIQQWIMAVKKLSQSHKLTLPALASNSIHACPLFWYRVHVDVSNVTLGCVGRKTINLVIMTSRGLR